MLIFGLKYFESLYEPTLVFRYFLTLILILTRPGLLTETIWMLILQHLEQNQHPAKYRTNDLGCACDALPQYENYGKTTN